MEIGDARPQPPAADRNIQHEVALDCSCRVDDAFELDPLAILATRRHAVERNGPGEGQRRLAQNAHPGPRDLRGKVASGTDALHLHQFTRSQRQLGAVTKVHPNTCRRILNK